MHFRTFLVAAVLSVGARAECPQVWSEVGRKLKDLFDDCNSNARQAIRLPFHDCFAGACDGSIILSDECTTRSENSRLTSICRSLGDIADQYDVDVADLIQVAAGVAVVSCPPSPTFKIRVGRKDNNRANPPGNIPPGTSTADELIRLFEQKGFSRQGLVALVGSHSAGVDGNNKPLDTTVNSLDSPTFYSQTQNGSAPASIPADRSLASDDDTKQ